MEALRGTGVALVTPFNQDLSIDISALESIVAFNIEGGTDYLVVLGTTAETATLTTAEKELVINTIVKANAGRLPLVLGVGGNNTAAVVEELNTRDLSEFVAILSVSPYYNKPTQEGIYRHFAAIAKASPLPIIAYNVPGRTGSNMLASTTVRLAKDFTNIVAIKEACGDMVQVMEIIENAPKNFKVISGDDVTSLPTVLAGGAGVISVIGQGLPVEFSKMIAFGLEGNSTEAYALHYAMQEGMDLIFQEGNPAGIKSIFEILSISGAAVRLPLVEASTDLKGKLKTFMNSFAGQLA